jgi:hypothetical protein
VPSTSTGGNTNDTVVIGAKSASGKCFWLQDVAGNPGTQWSTDTGCASAPAATTFTSQNPPS